MSAALVSLTTGEPVGIMLALASNEEGSMECRQMLAAGSRDRGGVATRARRAIGLFACAALLTASVAWASARTGTYSGSTSEGTAVTLKVVSHGSMIKNFKTSLGYNGKCGQGGGPVLDANIKKISIGSDGKFSKNFTLVFNHGGVHMHNPGKVSGKASGSKVTGKVVQFLKGKANKCYTETFTATKK